MKVYFYSKTPLSELDLTTIGGSDKRGDETKIGQFCSGLKYALALFLRHNVTFTARVKTNHYIEGHDRDVDIYYTVGKENIEDEQTGKSKEVIKFFKTSEYQNFHSVHTIDEFGGDYDTEIITGISTDLGFDWKLEYALREIWSNMIDEDGTYDENGEYYQSNKNRAGTIITLEFDDDSEFKNIWDNRYLYFLNSDPLITFTKGSNKVELRKNPEKFLRIYKQGILVHQSKNVESYYTYNINFGGLDERRVLLNTTSVISSIADIIMSDDTEESVNFKVNTESDESNVFWVETIWSDRVGPNLLSKVLELDGNIKTFNFISEVLKKMDNSPLSNRKIKTLKDSVYESQKTVEIVETPKQIEKKKEEKTVVGEIMSRYNFDIIYPVKEAVLVGSDVVADHHNKTILISENFDLDNEDHIVDFFIQYFDLDGERENIIKKLTKYILTKIKK